MRLRIVLGVCAGIGLVALASVVFWVDQKELTQTAPKLPTALPEVAALPEPELDPEPPSEVADSEFLADPLAPGAYGYDNDFRTDYDEGHWEYADVEEIREAIYARQIDHVDRLHLLDEFVETGDRDTRELWDTDWGSADDFKDVDNGFWLERGEDGSFYFVPDDETMGQYTFLEPVGAYVYDEEGAAFVRRIDYYGKPIVSGVKFLREDVLVMFVVSGDKVDLNIYEKASR